MSNSDPVKAWQDQISRLTAELDNFGPRDALLVFTEWLEAQQTVTKAASHTYGFEEFFLNPEEHGQDTIYITITEN